ncbi:glycoside hydrolase family 3 N-terminal domain-containing protein [Deinococcus apachensis]|uniref:glycoside hydrolase family 3 N-terminal domain-containing protein n=1 Tax=Deinococcus apachensis TaxID=309886 RepID=UPI00036CD4AB|nr:glycoside hydrolase family 3 N-terminal domain-containing protein [Deinococcus apachensis]
MHQTLLTALLLAAPAAAQTAPYLDPSLPTERRVEDLLGRMTLEEKVGQLAQIDVLRLMGQGEWDRGPLNPEWLENILAQRHVGSLLSSGGAAPVPNTPEAWARMTNDLQRYAIEHSRLKIPILYGIDAVHGHNTVIGATIFPHNLGLGATFDPPLARQIGTVTARALRATGITWNFAPDADMGRDPRWGRFYETWGEDPLLASTMVAENVRGQQGDTLGPNSVAATLKHFTGYGSPLGGKDRADARITDTELRAVHLPPFQAGLAAGAASVMVNSGSVNGVPAHASGKLLTDVLRKELGFTGVTISDWEDVTKLKTVYKVAPTDREAVRLALMAGVDVSMVPHDAQGFTEAVLDLVRTGEVPVPRIDEAAGHVLDLKFRLGLFERPYVDPAGAQAAVTAGQDLALRAARESVTLLATDGRTLPLGKTVKNVLVVGERAADPRAQLGGWTIGWQGLPEGESTRAVTVLNGMKAVVPPGTKLAYSTSVPARPSADALVVVVGEPPHAEGEADNPPLTLPDTDLALLRDAVATGKPVVAVLLAGRPLILPENIRTRLAALVMAYLPGSEGGRAVADVLYGNINPSGRLPFTWPKTLAQVPGPYDAPSSPGTPLYPFGHGLSYTTFTYSGLQAAGDRITVNVTNSGKVAGAHTVLAFARPRGAGAPPKLATFGRIILQPGETRNVALPLPRGLLPAGGAEIRVGDLHTNTDLP